MSVALVRQRQHWKNISLRPPTLATPCPVSSVAASPHQPSTSTSAPSSLLYEVDPLKALLATIALRQTRFSILSFFFLHTPTLSWAMPLLWNFQVSINLPTQNKFAGGVSNFIHEHMLEFRFSLHGLCATQSLPLSQRLLIKCKI